MADLIRLRDLPGIQRASDLCRNPRLWDYPQRSYTQQEIDEISISLFSITAADTIFEIGDYFDDDQFDDDQFEDDDEVDEDTSDPQTADSYEANFGAASAPWDDSTRTFWEAIGWDLSDGRGKELICAHLFARQIIAVEGKLVEGARFSADGSGREYFGDADGEDGGDDVIAHRLQREVDAFLAKRSRRP